jgi:hypothetical protein
VLYRKKDGGAIGGKTGAAELGSYRNAVEQLGKAAALSLGLEPVEAVGTLRARPGRTLIGGDPQAPFGVDGAVVG